MSKLTRGDKGELLVIDKINSLPIYHHLINNITLINPNSEMTHQIDHILIHPYGVFVIETKNYFGKIDGNPADTYWTRSIKDKVEKIHNPLKQNISHTKLIKRLLKDKYEVVPLIIFVRGNAPYTGDFNVINLSDLTLFLDSYPYKKIITNEEIDKINNLILKHSKDISKEEHIENIEILKKVRKENQEEISYAIMSNKCPWCDSLVVIKGYQGRCTKCDFKFKL